MEAPAGSLVVECIRSVPVELESQIKGGSMELPNVAHVRRDPKTGGMYDVRAYRQLSEPEIRSAVRHYLASGKRAERPKNGVTITIMTLLGA